MSINPDVIQASAQRLFPNAPLDQVMVELLLERAQRNLIKYQAMARQFETKYRRDFESFRQQVLSSQPDSETEQNYFDWELAVSGIADMEKEIERLRGSIQSP